MPKIGFRKAETLLGDLEPLIRTMNYNLYQAGAYSVSHIVLFDRLVGVPRSAGTIMRDVHTIAARKGVEVRAPITSFANAMDVQARKLRSAQKRAEIARIATAWRNSVYPLTGTEDPAFPRTLDYTSIFRHADPNYADPTPE